MAGTRMDDRSLAGAGSVASNFYEDLTVTRTVILKIWHCAMQLALGISRQSRQWDG